MGYLKGLKVGINLFFVFTFFFGEFPVPSVQVNLKVITTSCTGVRIF